MSEQNWEPGDVIGALLDGIEIVGIVRGGSREVFYADSMTTDRVAIKHLRNVRPLVTIDPEDDVETDRLRDLLRAHGADLNGANVYAALREYANPTPPKPQEPNAVGALVRDSDGEVWVRDVNGNWLCLHSAPGDDTRTWAELCERYGPISEVTP